jgi:hypothetical protein
MRQLPLALADVASLQQALPQAALALGQLGVVFLNFKSKLRFVVFRMPLVLSMLVV